MIVYSTKMGTKTGTFPIIKLKAPGLKLNFTTRIGGVSKFPFDSLNLGSGLGDDEDSVRANRDIVFRILGLDKDSVARAGQIHSSRVMVVEKAKMVKNCDGLITGRKNLTLVVSTADCFPVIIYSPSERALAALHVGRKGAGNGIIENALKILVDSYRINTSHTLAFMGPGICKKCYKLREKDITPFTDEFVHRRDGDIFLDLESFCIETLIRLGLTRGNIYTSGYCTSCNPELFFSYRREGGKTGRQWTLATITPPF